ncbi:MAG TPA: proton-conducting transporter membrane subunit [Opitutaceae bacterium]|nr:proton-conducting transporter membrane subunit [Opitutaceae bacterium]
MPGWLTGTAAIALAAGTLLGLRTPRIWLAATLLAATALLAAAIGELRTGVPWDWHSRFLVAGQQVHWRMDAISAVFIAVLAFVGGLGAVYSRGYWDDRHHPRSAPRSRVWWSAMLLSMLVVLLSANGLHFLIAWELFALCSYFLITLERRDTEVRAAGWLYLAASHAGTLCLFAFFSALAARTGTWELGPVRDHPELAPLFWIALAGFGVKAGLFPLHIWLPSAHANAPSHVSALMSGVAIKLGLYGIIRFGGWLPLPPAAGWVVMAVGAVTGLLGIAFALAQDDFKRLLAYSSVENIGIILVGVGGGLLGVTHGDTAWGRLAMAGALLHLWNHAVFKSLLFFGAGSVLHATGTREMSRLGGLWRAMPWTAILFATGAVAVAALPPLNGFVSEWLVYLGLFGAVTSHHSAAVVAMPAIIVLGTTGALALAAFVKASAMIFLGGPRTALARSVHESGRWMLGPMLVGAVACLALGLVPLVFWPGISTAVGAWNSGWAAEPAANPLRVLGPVQVGIAATVLLGVAVLRRRAVTGPVPVGPTWDCGYAAPTARMQYTSGSFAGIATGWFGWILAPERRMRRPRGFFPAEASRIERFPETVLERVLGPAARLTLRFAATARRLQHGRLQFYIAYVVVGLLGLAALVVTGVKP